MTDTTQTLPVPEMDGPSVVFGNISHMPKFDTLPEEFQRERSPYCRAVQSWFFSGARRAEDGGLEIKGKTFRPRDGIDAAKALRAITAVLGSWEPKHEHKIAACGFMLSQWFELVESKSAA